MVMTDRTAQASPSAFFGFPPPRPAGSTPPLTPTTRQLCCAAYVDSEFANTVIREVVDDEHRAVPPALDTDFDLDPVVRHCYRARRLLLWRDLLLTALVLIGLLTATLLTLLWLTVGALVFISRSAAVRAMPWPTRIRVLAWAAVAGITLSCFASLVSGLFTLLLALLAAQGGSDLLGSATDGNAGVSVTQAVSSVASMAVLLTPLALAVFSFALLVAFRVKTYGILTRDLAPERTDGAPDLPNRRVERRMAWVSSMQRGNLALQSNVRSPDGPQIPILGAGQVWREWSFALPLKPRNGHADNDGQRVTVDPVRLNQVVRQSLLRLRDPGLPEGERVPGLYLLPYVVADGARQERDPLIEPRERIPYALATPAAIEAIIRHPQGSLRYYQRAVVGASGKSVRTADHREVAPAQDQQIAMSLFVHVAVEGGMLYLESITTVMPPPRAEYTLLDALHTSTDRILGLAVRTSWRDWPADCLAAPRRAMRSMWQIATATRRMDRAHRDSREFRVYEYGARLSVRELAAEPELPTWLQFLDADKYAKVAERAAVDAVFTHLGEQGVDTAEFSSRSEFVQNVQSVNFNVNGNTFESAAAFGMGATATTT